MLSGLKVSHACHPRRFSLYEPVDFVRHFLLDKLDWTKVRDSVAVHVPCSSKKMGLADAFTQVASLCAHEVTHTGVPCCGARPSPFPAAMRLGGMEQQHAIAVLGHVLGHGSHMRRTGSAQGCEPKETGTLGLFMDADDATSCNVATLAMRSILQQIDAA